MFQFRRHLHDGIPPARLDIQRIFLLHFCSPISLFVCSSGMLAEGPSCTCSRKSHISSKSPHSHWARAANECSYPSPATNPTYKLSNEYFFGFTSPGREPIVSRSGCSRMQREDEGVVDDLVVPLSTIEKRMKVTHVFCTAKQSQWR